MTSASALSDLDLLVLAADIADRESMRTWRSDDLAVVIKPDGSPVSAADRLIERMLRELLAEHRPHDRVLGEEEGDVGTGARCWVIDPIDGTDAYVGGRRAWGSLIALELDGAPAAGIASMPALGRRWWGTVDGGAWARSEPRAAPRQIGVSTQSATDRIRWSSGPVIDELAPFERAQLAHLDDVGRCVPMNEWTTYPALMVAEGSLELAVHFGHHWDHAALAAVVVAAGGEVSYGTAPAAGERFAAAFSNGRVATI